MVDFGKRGWRLMSALLIVILVLVGCGRGGQAGNADNGDVQIALQPRPAEETLVVVLSDASGAPITDATVALEGNMNHAGMVPVLADAVADDADGSADGRYHLPFTFTMLGDWIITVTVNQADGSTFSRNLDVRAGSESFEGDAVLPLEEGAAAPGTLISPVNVHDVMARPAPLAGGTGAVYFVLHNGGETTLKFMGAESPAASAVEIHTTINDNGVMRMRQITEGVEVAPDAMVEFAPGGMHLMLIDLVAPLAEGEVVAVTLHFEHGDTFTFDAPVVNMDDMPGDGEMEHSH